jgi:hypothetical protein
MPLGGYSRSSFRQALGLQEQPAESTVRRVTADPRSSFASDRETGLNGLEAVPT